MIYVILGVVIVILLLIGVIVVMSFVIKGLGDKLKKTENLLKDSLSLNEKYKASIQQISDVNDDTKKKKKELYETEHKDIISRANNLFL